MRIGIDARRLARDRLDGRLSYLRNALAAILAADDTNEYVLLVDGPLREPLPSAKGRVRVVTLPRRFGRAETAVTDWWRLGAASRALGLDGVHLPVDPYPRGTVPHVVTAHDLMPYEEHYRCGVPWSRYLHVEAVLAYSRVTYARVARSARRVICITQYMKDEFKKHLGLPDSQLTVIYPGGDNRAFRVIEDESALSAFREARGLRRRYVMAFGNKNLAVLLAAYSLLPAAMREEFSLVVTGPTIQTPEQLAEMAGKLGIGDQVHFESRPIPHEELCWFYNAADLFVLPSQYEMFCNMILEAMRCRCPVLASGLKPNIEVGADAMAYYSGINDPDDLAAALRQLLDSQDRRADLGARGHARGATFTWQRHAQMVVALYAEAFAP